jgi:hypothetical protein
VVSTQNDQLEEERKMKRHLLWLALLVVIISVGCAQKEVKETKEVKEVIELDISDSKLEALTPAMETGLVGFYALKEVPPETMDNVKMNGTMVACFEATQLVSFVSQVRALFGISGMAELVLCNLVQDCGAACVEALEETPQSIALVEMGLKIERNPELIEVMFK